MKIKIVYLIACLMAASTTILCAQDKPADRPTREQREQFKNMTPEERQQKLKEMREKNPGLAAEIEKRRGEEMKKAAEELGLNTEELKKLSPEERRKKFQEAADAKIAELNKKKTDGKLTEDETKLLEKLERRQKAMEAHRSGAKPEEGKDRPGKRERPSDKK